MFTALPKVYIPQTPFSMFDLGPVPPGLYATLPKPYPLTYPPSIVLCSRLLPVVPASTHTAFRAFYQL